MLHKDWISNVEIYSDEWHQFRLGKFTSSKIHCLMTDRPFTEDGVAYINQKVGEKMTGHSTCGEDEIIEDENTVWGIQNEPVALKEFAKLKGLKYLVVGKTIHEPGSNFSSTPDAIWVLNSSVTKEDCYNVATVEVKCPHKFNRFIPLSRCKTPADVKKKNRGYFWQVIDQMHNCGASIGYFVVYHPYFPAGKNMRVIEFKKIDLWPEFAFLEQRKKQSLDMFLNIYSEFLN